MTDDQPLWQRGALRLLLKVLLAAALIALIVSRWSRGDVPPDLSAYLAAAETFSAGGNPYGPALRDASSFAGYPYVYPPGTLYLIAPLDWLSPRAASLLHAVVSAGVLVGLASWCRRRFLPDIPTEVLLAGLVLFGPILVDLLVGNISILLLGTVAAALASSEAGGERDPPGVFQLAGLIVVGVILAFKAMWAAPVLLAVALRRQWRRLAAVATGLAGITLLSTLDTALLAAWWTQLRRIPAIFPNSYDLVSLAPALAPIAALAWLLSAAVLIRRSRDNAWFAGALSVPAWPRLAPYSFALLVLPLLQAARHRPRPVLALAAPMWGPFYWLWADTLPPLAGRWLHLLWALASTTLAATILLRYPTRQPDSR